jgi:hypothetical protein
MLVCRYIVKIGIHCAQLLSLHSWLEPSLNELIALIETRDHLTIFCRKLFHDVGIIKVFCIAVEKATFCRGLLLYMSDDRSVNKRILGRQIIGCFVCCGVPQEFHCKGNDFCKMDDAITVMGITFLLFFIALDEQTC